MIKDVEAGMGARGSVADNLVRTKLYFIASRESDTGRSDGCD